MGKEGVRMRDKLSLRLYDKDGNLVFTSKKKEPFLDRILRFLLSLLRGKG